MGGKIGISSDPSGEVRRIQARERDCKVGTLVAKQHGRISRAQLLELGLTGDAIDGSVQRAQFAVEHRGVYAVGHASKTLEGRVMAAVLACGQGAVASHRSAAQLLGLLPVDANPREIDVTVTSRNRRQQPGIRVHHAKLDHRDTRIHDDIPITGPARVLLDLAAGGNENEFESAFDEAVHKRLAKRPQLDDVIARNARRRGAARLRALHQAEVENRRNRLEAEKLMAGLIRQARLPPPNSNARVGRFVVDFLWPEHRLIVETDGFATHGSRSAFEADRARDGDLQALGYAVMRVTWRQLTGEPHAVVARLAGALALAGRELALA